MTTQPQHPTEPSADCLHFSRSGRQLAIALVGSCVWCENARLKAELEAARKDAERYRWLKDQRRWYYNKPPVPGISIRYENLIQGPTDWIDAAIDSAKVKP